MPPLLADCIAKLVSLKISRCGAVYGLLLTLRSASRKLLLIRYRQVTYGEVEQMWKTFLIWKSECRWLNVWVNFCTWYSLFVCCSLLVDRFAIIGARGRFYSLPSNDPQLSWAPGRDAMLYWVSLAPGLPPAKSGPVGARYVARETVESQFSGK